ncbi:hypothetical protein MWU63_17730 [Pseudohalocynthiibacter sp. F2068]|nr:hypothetical protein [Pseudohalocynthiibacter sp. F2068]
MTNSVLHIAVNMGKVFERVQKNIESAGAYDTDNYIVLSRDISRGRLNTSSRYLRLCQKKKRRR